MANVILNVNTLPEPLSCRIHAKKVRVYEMGGIITLVPIDEKQPPNSRLRGMLADGKLSTEKYLIQKKLDKELES